MSWLFAGRLRSFVILAGVASLLLNVARSRSLDRLLSAATSSTGATVTTSRR